MTHASLFSGIGGFDLAADWTGWKNLFNCEKDPFCRQILNYYWPQAISYEDIKTTDFKPHREAIDVLTGGFPCQPFSTAGKRAGADDDRYLWPEMLRAIREIHPRVIVAENVPGLLTIGQGLVFEQVCTDLEGEGYEVQPFIIPACGVNAPHRRDRVWFVAYSDHIRCKRLFNAAKGRNVMTNSLADAIEQGMMGGNGSRLSHQYVAEMMGFPSNWSLLPFARDGVVEL